MLREPMSDEPPSPKDFTSLYRATISPLRRYLARLLGNTTEAQDVAHDAYLRVYPSVENKSADKPEALLYVTARRLAINRLKRRSISPEGTAGSADPAHETTAAASPTVPQQVMARQELALLKQAIAELPEGCRAVLLLRKVELLSHREIADRLGIAVSTVEKQHARALRLLRAALPSETLPHHTTDESSTPDQEARS
jgi:RNA polymerase sigma factor (sigma-70 family)